MREALEAHEWGSPTVGDVLDDDLDFEVDDEAVACSAELGEDSGLREPILPAKNQDLRENLRDAGEEKEELGAEEEQEGMQVEELETLILKMQAIKDMGVSMPEAERKKFAAKAVRDAMKQL